MKENQRNAQRRSTRGVVARGARPCCRDVWLPYLIASTICAGGAGITHIVDMVQNGNFAPNDAGPILYADFLIPVARILLYVFWLRGSAPEPRLAQS